jgi:hypothetical protein
MKEIRKVIREEIIRAVKIYHEEVETYEKPLTDKSGNICYGMRPATAREKLNLFVGLLEEKGNETIRSL